MLDNLLPATLIVGALYAYYFGVSWLLRRLWKAGRITARTMIFVQVGKLPLVAVLVGLIAWSKGTGIVVVVAVVGGSLALWALRYGAAAWLVPDLEQSLSRPSQDVLLGGLSWPVKMIVFAFFGLAGVAGFFALVLITAYTLSRGMP